MLDNATLEQGSHRLMNDVLGPFWADLIAPFLEHTRPGAVLLVGGGDGALLQALLTQLRQQGGMVHVADPSPAFEVPAIRALGGDQVILHPASGRDVATLVKTPDVVLLNGAAHWHAVHGVLHALRGQAAKLNLPFPVVLSGHTGWPYGRRDQYPDPKAVPAHARHAAARGGLVPGQAGLAGEAGLFADRWHATAANTPGNGVLTAIEEFVADASGSLGFAALPMFHGLGVLYARDRAPDALLAALAMSPALRRVAEAAEQSRVTLAAEGAGLRHECAALRAHVEALHAALREAQRGEAAQDNVAGALGAAPVAAPMVAPMAAAEAPAALIRARRAARLIVSAARARLGAKPQDVADDHARLIARLRASPAFNAEWYMARYPDVAESGADPAEHYYRHGAAEGRDPGPDFVAAYYREQNPDVAEAGMNPLLHYLLDGAAEGRDPSPHFDTRYYLAAHPDVVAAGHNALEHYISSGRAEGRRARPA
jgi:hypothetical protein